MRNMPVRLGLVALLMAVPAARAAAEPPRPVHLLQVEGLPPDARSRDEFLGAFRAAFAQPVLAIVDASGRRDSTAHGFVLADSDGPSSWQLQVVIGAPPLLRDVVRDRKGRLLSQKPNGRRASRGLTLVVAALSPEAVAAGARPVPERLGLVLPEPGADAARIEVSRGVEFAWDQAGLAAGRVALEVLVRAAGEGPEGEWTADIAPVLRRPSPR